MIREDSQRTEEGLIAPLAQQDGQGGGQQAKKSENSEEALEGEAGGSGVKKFIRQRTSTSDGDDTGGFHEELGM
jgi:hypothetical protein